MVGTVNTEIISDINEQEKADGNTAPTETITPSVDKQIENLEKDYEAVKEEFEEANHVKVEASMELQEAAETYDAAKNQLLQVQANHTAVEIENEVKDSNPEDAGAEIVNIVNSSQEISIDTAEYLNMLTTYRQSLLNQGYTEEKANEQVAGYHQCVLDYNASLKAYKDRYTEYQSADEEVNEAYKELVNITKNPEAEATVNLNVKNELANTQTNKEAIDSTKAILIGITNTLKDNDSDLSKAIHIYFANNSSHSLDSQGLNWANGLGERTQANMLSETINETIAEALKNITGYGKENVEQFKSQYNWKIVESSNGSYTISVSANSKSTQQIACTLNTADDTTITTNWIALKEQEMNNSIIHVLNPEQKTDYDKTTDDENYNKEWLQFQEDNKKYTDLNEEEQKLLQDNKNLAHVIVNALQDTDSDLNKVVSEYFNKNSNSDLDFSGTNWANGNAGGDVTINTMMAKLIKESLGDDYTDDYVKDNYYWKLQNTKDGYKLYISPKELKDKDGKNIVYIIGGIGNASKENTSHMASATLGNDNKLIVPGTTVSCEELELSNKITNEVKKIFAGATLKNYTDAAENLLKALTTLKNSIGNPDISYEDAVQKTIEAAENYIDELYRAGSTEELTKNATSYYEGNGEERQSTAATGTTGTTRTATGTASTIAALNDLITELQDTIEQPEVIRTINDTSTPLGDAFTSQEKVATERETDEVLISTDGNTTIAEEAVPKAPNATTMIEDEDVALADALSTNKSGGFAWWILALLTGVTLQTKKICKKKANGIHIDQKHTEN